MKLRLAILLRRMANRLDPLDAVMDRVFAEKMPWLAQRKGATDGR